MKLASEAAKRAIRKADPVKRKLDFNAVADAGAKDGSENAFPKQPKAKKTY